MSRQKGFTLVELLVVIAIIALLMSILMPALARVRNQAKAILCLSNLKQMGSAFAMYLDDNDCKFMRGYILDTPPDAHKRYWMEALRPYYGNEGDARLCPVATKMGRSRGGVVTGGEYNTLGGKGSAWGYFSGEPCGSTTNPWPYVVACDYGSYSINGWLQDPEEGKAMWISPQKDYNWRHCNLKGTANIPLLGDGKWIDCWPDFTDEDPAYDGQPWSQVPSQMARICMDRHGGYVNWVFCDYAARPVGLKELWKLKWNKFFELDADPPLWEPWMKRYKDYD
ncbi:MAG: type II secretion system protein [Planctomycetota bacterium]|nr:MAG: type II secretion system protein [Planctomycetota bacterium]